MSDLSMFHFYATHDKLTECENILSSSKDLVNFKDKLENTLLIYYANENNTAICKLLIKYGADVNAFNVNGKSALIHACISSNEELVDILLEKKADPNYVKKNQNGKAIGSNALMFACEKDNYKIVEKLITITDINYKNDSEQNAFMYCCKTVGEHQFKKASLFANMPNLDTKAHDFLGNNYLLIVARQNNLQLIEHFVLQLELYNPELLLSVRKESESSGSKILSSTVEYIENIYKTVEFKTKLDVSLPTGKSKKGLKI